MIVEAAGVRLTAPDAMPDGARAIAGRVRTCLRLGITHDRAEHDMAGLENWAYTHRHAARMRLTVTQEQRHALLRALLDGWS